MKQLFKFTLIAPIILLMMGCPVDTKYPISVPGSEKINQALLGTWVNKQPESEADVIRVSIGKKDDYTYKVEVIEKGAMYMADTNLFEGFVTKLEGKDFFYVKPVGSENKYYLYHYSVDGSKLITHDVSLKEGGLDAITSTEAFQAEVRASLKHPDCLMEEILWEKGR